MSHILITKKTAEMMIRIIREQQQHIETAHRIIFDQQCRFNILEAELKATQETAEQMLDIIPKLNPSKRDGDENAV